MTGPEDDITLDRRGGLKALGAHVVRLTAPLARQRGTATARLAAEWSAIVGPDIARQSLPERLVGGGGGRAPRGGGARDKRPATAAPAGGTLRLRVDGPLALELQHAAPQIIDRINGYFGYAAVARLRIVQGPLPHRAPPAPPSPRRLDGAEARALQERVAPVGDTALREALERLGKAILTKG
jgi:hypothetical protein